MELLTSSPPPSPVSTLCPFCSTDTGIERELDPQLGSVALDELETLIRNEWRARLGPSSYERDQPRTIIRALIVYALVPQSPVRSAVVEHLILRNLTTLGEWGLGRADIQREWRHMTQAVSHVLTAAGLDTTRSLYFKEQIDAKVGGILDWPEASLRPTRSDPAPVVARAPAAPATHSGTRTYSSPQDARPSAIAGDRSAGDTAASPRTRRSNPFRRRVEQLLSAADVAIGGDRPWDLQVHDQRLYARLAKDGSLGLGESYMDGWWDCEQLDEFSSRLLRSQLETKIKPGWEALRGVRARLLNLQRPGRSARSVRHHYEIGNDLYRRMLDSRMIYSCAYWRSASTLDAAQEAKLDLVCRKLGLEPGMRLLDIGCGWGGMAKFAAERYQVSVVGITLSPAQVQLARDRCRGLDIDIRLQDYRDLSGEFDRVLSLGMLEHVGRKNYDSFMRTVRACLRDDGLFLLHTIGGNRSVSRTEPWIDRYIFPNSMLPSPTQITSAAKENFVIEDWHNFGSDYDRTLMHWFDNFDRHRDNIESAYDQRFYRMWKFYLLSCAGSFRARKNQLWQLVLSPSGVPGGYLAPR